MKSHGRPELQVTESAPSDGSCCQVSTAPLAPINAALTNQSRQRLQDNQHEYAGAKLNPLGLERLAYPEAAPPSSNSSHQALLCVFLV